MHELGKQTIEFIETWCFVPEGALVGQPIKLLEFQKAFIMDMTAPETREAYLSIARKNGKTALTAAIILAYLVGPPAMRNAEIISVAMAEKQAKILFNYLVKMIQLSSYLEGICHIEKDKKVTGLLTKASYRPFSSKASTIMGASPRLAIFDEIGQIRGETDDLYSAVMTSQSAYADAKFIGMSTQAATDSDLFSLLLDNAIENPRPEIKAHIYSSDPDKPLDDENEWAKANPALGVFKSKKHLASTIKRAMDIPAEESSCRNLELNQRVESRDPYISRKAWQETGKTAPVLTPEIRQSITWVGGLDLGQTRDLTAYVKVGWHENFLYAESYFWLPAEGMIQRVQKYRQPFDKWAKQGYITLTLGATVDYSDIAKKIYEDIQMKQVSLIAFDRWKMNEVQYQMKLLDASKADLDRLIPFNQSSQSMDPAMRKLDETLYSKRLVHFDNPVLNMCARNAVVKQDHRENRMIMKVAETRPIDGIVALIMATGSIASSVASDDKTIYDNDELMSALLEDD